MSCLKQVPSGLLVVLLSVGVGMASGSVARAGAPYARAGWVADIPPGIHDAQAQVTIVDDQTLQVEHFTYDHTGAPAVYFYLGANDTDSAFENGLQLDPHLTRSYFDESLTLTLPTGQTLDGYNAVSVWCAEFMINFSSASFVAPEPESVPAVSTWGLAVLSLSMIGAGTLLYRRRTLAAD